jgi:hypothetical protein
MSETANDTQRLAADEARLTITLPKPLREELERLAALSDRSLSAETRVAITSHCMGFGFARPAPHVPQAST